MESTKERRTELDMLRLAATLAVIATHLCGGVVKQADVNSDLFVQLNTLRSLLTWSVPEFVMISGCLFLAPEKKITTSQLYKKYIRHIAVCFAVWSAVFQIYYLFAGEHHLNFFGIISEFLIGPYPFWYLWMLIGLYMIIPFLRTFSEDRKLVGYFLILFIAGEFAVNYGTKLPGIGILLEEILKKSYCYFVLGFTGYYLMGYYLLHSSISVKMEMILYALGITCAAFAAVGTTWQSQAQGVYNEWFSKYLMPNVIIESAALFVFFTRRVSKIHFSLGAKNILKQCSTLGFGVYLIHGLVIEGFNYLGITVSHSLPLILTIILTTAVYFISAGLTWAIRQIPWIGRQIT